MQNGAAKKATKGRGVRVVGRLKQDTWKDEAGKSASRIYVIAEHIEYKPAKKSEEAESQAKPQAAGQTEAPAESQTENQPEAQKEAEPVPVEAEAVF